MMKFHKYHGLGNDYVVIDPREFRGPLDPRVMKLLCDRNFGIGADGVLYGPLDHGQAKFAVRIFNPDGSEAEKSGNGLRIFSRYLWDAGLVKGEAFTISTPGGIVTAHVLDKGACVRVGMGRVSFQASEIPVAGKTGEVLRQTIQVGSRTFTYCAATVGNPHCVILCESLSPEMAREFGPLIERNPLFPNRTNVQFLHVIDQSAIEIEIWERGAGYTLASGSSSVAAAAVAHRLGLCGSAVHVRMPGGTLDIDLAPDFSATMTGPVAAVYDGELRDGFPETAGKT